MVSLLGDIRLSRAYYHCARCHNSQVPWDLCVMPGGEHKVTLAASEVATLAGTLDNFAQASTTLLKLAGLRLSESTVLRITEDAGARLKKLLEDKKIQFGPNRQWNWQRDANGKTCAYVSVDATGVPRQGPEGAKAECRMAYVGMIYNPDSEHDPRRVPEHQVRYLAGFYDLGQLGLQLRRQAGQVGWDQAEQQIALTDGGNGLEEFMQRNFPRAQCILDFYHATEHVGKLARALHPSDQAAFEQEMQTWCHQLKHEGGRALLATWEKLDLSNCSEAVRTEYHDQSRYVRNNLHRMDYPTYLANGWQIGSGPVEAACKTVVGQRLKESGMRWGDPGADAVCHLSALYRSERDQWQFFWATQAA